MEESFFSFYNLPFSFEEKKESQLIPCPNFSASCALHQLFLLKEPEEALQATTKRFQKLLPIEADQHLLQFLAGLKRGFEWSTDLNKNNSPRVWLVSSRSPAFFAGLLLSFSQTRQSGFLGYLPEKDLSRRKVSALLHKKLHTLQKLSYRPIEGVENIDWDVLPFYLKPNAYERAEIRRRAHLFYRTEKRKLNTKLAKALYGLLEVARFLGRHNKFLLAYIA